MFDGISNIAVISSEFTRRSYLYFKDILLPVCLMNSFILFVMMSIEFELIVNMFAGYAYLVLVGVMNAYIFVLRSLRCTVMCELRSPYVDGIVFNLLAHYLCIILYYYIL